MEPHTSPRLPSVDWEGRRGGGGRGREEGGREECLGPHKVQGREEGLVSPRAVGRQDECHRSGVVKVYQRWVSLTLSPWVSPLAPSPFLSPHQNQPSGGEGYGVGAERDVEGRVEKYTWDEYQCIKQLMSFFVVLC